MPPRYIPRACEAYVRGAFQRFPALALLGPRQSGKTTLARRVFGELPYSNLEDPAVRAQATEDPVGYLDAFPNGAVLDEIQNVPGLFSHLQPRLDEADRSAQFVLTGSHQFKLVERITQSLAGRVALTKLLPLSLAELRAAGRLAACDLDEAIWRGGYPRAWADDARPGEVYLSYLETYIERDVRLLVNLKDSDLFRRFLQLVAGRTGRLLNKESLARDVGVDPKTVESWLAALEASFVVVRLQPWHANLGKRLIKTPKIYMVDVGLACHLLRIEEPRQLSAHPLRGELFETMIVGELLKRRFQAGKAPNLYFYRDSGGTEVDLVMEYADGIYPIEIKAASTYTPRFAAALAKLATVSPRGGAVVLGGGSTGTRGTTRIVPWMDLPTFAEEQDL
jgi:predicted AAA+ superfamily ATPase